MARSFFSEAALRRLPRGPRVHPNGFIQLDLDAHRRLHVWTGAEKGHPLGLDCHDHAYDFESEVLVGAMRNVTYAIDELAGGPWKVLLVRPFAVIGDASAFAHEDGVPRYDARAAAEQDVSAGGRYSLAARVFHRTVVRTFTATVITIAPYDRDRTARVLVPHGMAAPAIPPREPFDPEPLWRHIRTLCA